MPAVTVRLSEEARRGWEKITLRHGITLTALIEACGLMVNDRPGFTDDEHKPGVVNREIVELARRLDADRRSRR